MKILYISIHALREEGDGILYWFDFTFTEFLSTPSARRATSIGIAPTRGPTFLSTPSARRATHRRSRRPQLCGNFYPRPPRGGRPRSPIA